MKRQAAIESALSTLVPITDLISLIVDYASLKISQHETLAAFKDANNKDLTLIAESTDKEFIFGHDLLQQVLNHALSFPFGKSPALLDVLVGVVGDFSDPRLVAYVPQIARLTCYLPKSFCLCKTLRQIVSNFTYQQASNHAPLLFALLQNPTIRDPSCLATILSALTTHLKSADIVNLVHFVPPRKNPELMKLEIKMFGLVSEIK